MTYRPNTSSSAGQQHARGGSAVVFGVWGDGDAAVVAFADQLSDGEAEACAGDGEFGGDGAAEEAFEYVRAFVGGYAVAGVADGELQWRCRCF